MAWLGADRADDALVLPNLTVADWRAFMGPQPAPEGFVFEQRTYGTAGRGGRPLKAWLYRPTDTGAAVPAVVFLHGGGWQGHHPLLHGRHAAHLAAEGIASMLVSYRLCPEGTIGDCVADAKCAVRWLRANADPLGVDPERIAAAGGSAGGHLSAMLATTPGLFEGEGGCDATSSHVACAVLWYPATDLRVQGATWPNLYEEIGTLLGDGGADDGLRRALSPVTHVSASTAPILTMTGDQDDMTTVGMIREFHAALDSAGVTNHLEVLPGRAHAFDLVPGDWEVCYAMLSDYLRRMLQPAG